MFNLWRSGLGKNARTKLDLKRLRAIRRALRPENRDGFGFTHDEVERSLRGWIALCQDDPWRMERASHHEFALFLRDAQHVEQGLEYADRVGGGAAGSAVVEEALEEARRRREEDE